MVNNTIREDDSYEHRQRREETHRLSVNPQRVEEVLETSDHVKSACVVRMQEKDNTAAKAYIVLHDGAENDKSKVEKVLRELCQRELPEYSCPSCYEFIDSLPLTAVGKVDYKALER